ncbi:MAG TPA: c-type cytochrome [Hyphomicrobiales bacterium]|nr:c-type cytochrome [Hyphomicrobiales bacterium]
MKKTLMIAAAAAFMVSGFAATEAIAGPEAKCKACHNFDSTDKKVGPGLKGIVGRTMGSVEGFKYGSYLKSQNAAGAVWDEAALRAWIENSKHVAKAAGGKTKMPPQKMKGAKADKVIAFLKTL